MAIAYYGQPAENFGAVESDGTPLWDAQFSRDHAWYCAGILIRETTPGPARSYLSIMSERAAYTISHNQLTREEMTLMGEQTTDGSFPKRRRFWRFVRMRLVGTTPGDLRDADRRVRERLGLDDEVAA